MDYSLREMECFLAVAEEGSFSAASRRLHLAQPPITRHVRALEGKIGCELFTRTPSGARLTDAGRAFLEGTRGIPARLTAAAEAARARQNSGQRTLRIGFISAVMSERLETTLAAFRQKHRDVRIMLYDMPPDDQLKAIESGELDGGFIGVAPERADGPLVFSTWYAEDLVALVPADHALAARKSIRLTDLRDEPFIAVSGSAASAYSRLLQQVMRKGDVRPQVVLTTPRAQAVALMVAAGSGVSVLPASLARLVSRTVVAIPLAGRPQIKHAFAMPRHGASPLLGMLLG